MNKESETQAARKIEFSVYEIVKKLIGEILPAGETNRDDIRFDNLKMMTDLVGRLVCDIDDVAYANKDREEFSIKRAADHASNFLSKDLGIDEIISMNKDLGEVTKDKGHFVI